MRSGIRVRIIADGGANYGYGHLSRSRELTYVFEQAGFGVDYVDLFSSSLAPAQYSAQRSANQDLTIIDLPYDGDAWLAEARSSGQCIIGLDYFGHGCPDIIIRMNPPLAPVPCHRLLYGLDYAIIRRDIRAAPRSNGNHVLVVIGGADINDRGETVAKTVSDWGFETILVRGPLTKRGEISAQRFAILDDPPDFAWLLGGCAWAVTNGGTTMVEAMSLGKAVYAIPQTPEETRFADALAQQGLLLGAGPEVGLPPTTEEIAATAWRAGTAVDGRGGDRIVQLGQDLILSRHSVNATKK
jgi:spore coat polysaccharide biosynthesis predicted glycosyltransferase SpsG